MQIELIAKTHSTPTLFQLGIQYELLRRGFVLGVVGALAFLHSPQPALHSQRLNPQVQNDGAKSLHSFWTPDLIKEEIVNVFQPLVRAIVETKA